MLLKNKYHLSYCTNIHPGQDWDRTFSSLKQYVPKIKSAVCNAAPFGLGLRLSNKASEELNIGNRLFEFKEWLDSNGLYVFTTNGFPYGNFHQERVKENVHKPDWTSPQRLQYTRRLFEQLAFLIPEGIDGGISTSPLSYKYWYAEGSARDTAFEKAAENLSKIAFQLYELEKNTGKYLHLDIEPEPDGLLENSEELVAFFETYLLPVAKKSLSGQLKNPESGIEEIVRRYITVCYDICHFSLAYEAPQDTFRRFRKAGIRIGKIQVSAALKVLFEGDKSEQIWQALAAFDEPTYLHQATEQVQGKVKTYPDLSEVLKDRKELKELRAHFHVPIFLDKFDLLYSTQDQILEVLEYLQKNELCRHLEVETYTWEVLPAPLKLELSESIIRELNWLTEKL